MPETAETRKKLTAKKSKQRKCKFIAALIFTFIAIILLLIVMIVPSWLAPGSSIWTKQYPAVNCKKSDFPYGKSVAEQCSFPFKSDDVLYYDCAILTKESKAIYACGKTCQDSENAVNYTVCSQSKIVTLKGLRKEVAYQTNAAFIATKALIIIILVLLLILLVILGLAICGIRFRAVIFGLISLLILLIVIVMVLNALTNYGSKITGWGFYLLIGIIIILLVVLLFCICAFFPVLCNRCKDIFTPADLILKTKVQPQVWTVSSANNQHRNERIIYTLPKKSPRPIEYIETRNTMDNYDLPTTSTTRHTRHKY